MAKRARPQWGFDGVHLVEHRPLQHQHADKLLDALKVAGSAERKAAADMLQHIASTYASDIRQQIVPRGAGQHPPKGTYDAWNGAPLTRAERNAALTALLSECARFRRAFSKVVSAEAWVLGDGTPGLADERFLVLSNLGEGLTRMARKARAAARSAGPSVTVAQAFRRLANRAVKLALTLGALDHMSEGEVLRRLRADARAHIETVHDLMLVFGYVEEAATRALAAGKEVRGPEERIGLADAVADLVPLWDRFTGGAATHTPRLKTHRDGVPHSAAGAFVVDFFKFVDPSIPKTSLSTALERHIRARNKAKRSG